MSLSKKMMCVGPGGMKCHCCFPAPGSKERKLVFRSAKRKEKKEAFKISSIDNEDELK